MTMFSEEEQMLREAVARFAKEQIGAASLPVFSACFSYVLFMQPLE